MLVPLEPLRAQVRARGESAATQLAPVLVAREVLEGDLSFAGSSDDATDVMSRPGATLLLEDRITARERLTGPPLPGRKALRDELYCSLTPGPSGSVSIGRGTANDIVLRDPSVSTRHARIHRMPETDWCFVVDLGSRNGTIHNGARMAPNARAELISGDEIALGRVLLVYLTPPDLYRYLCGSL